MFAPASIALVGAVGVLVAVWAAVARRTGIPDLPDRFFAPLQPALPRLAAASLGVTLVALAVTNSFLAPHLSLGPQGWVFALIEASVGVWLVAGARLRAAAAAVGLLGVIGLALNGPVALLESGHMWGIAWFLWLTSQPGRSTHRPSLPGQLRSGVAGIRLGLGVALIVGGLSEKFAFPSIAGTVIAANPALNVMQVVGLDTAAFIRVAGASEILFGLLILAGVAPRVVACLTAVPFLATVPLFGRVELIGHLPYYSALLVLLAVGATGRHRRVGLGPPATTPAEPGTLVGAGVQASE